MNRLGVSQVFSNLNVSVTLSSSLCHKVFDLDLYQCNFTAKAWTSPSFKKKWNKVQNIVICTCADSHPAPYAYTHKT